MKKTLFAVALGFTGLVSAKQVINLKTFKDVKGISVDCTHVTFLCNGSYDICNFKGIIVQFFKLVEAQEKDVCGKKNNEEIPSPEL